MKELTWEAGFHRWTRPALGRALDGLEEPTLRQTESSVLVKGLGKLSLDLVDRLLRERYLCYFKIWPTDRGLVVVFYPLTRRVPRAELHEYMTKGAIEHGRGDLALAEHGLATQRKEPAI